MKKSKKKKSGSITVGQVLLFVMGLFAGSVIMTTLEKLNVDLTSYTTFVSFTVFLLVLYVAFFVNIIVHEAGHLVFGLLSGYKFGSFRMASFMIIRENCKIRLKRHSITGTGGQCLMVPPDMKNGRIPVTLYNLGGCIMNLLFAVLLLVLHSVCGEYRVFSLVTLTFAVIGILAVVTNGIPIHTADIDNDGYNALSLRNNPEAMRGFWVQLKAVEQISKGIRLKDMPDEWFDIPSDESMKNSMVAARCVLVCNRLTDSGKYEEADALISHILSVKSATAGIHRNLLLCDRIFIELITENRPDAIDSMLSAQLKKFMKAMKNCPSVIRTQYALALLYNNDKAVADKIMKRFEKIEKTYPYPCEIQGEKEMIAEINVRADSRDGKSVSP